VYCECQYCECCGELIPAGDSLCCDCAVDLDGPTEWVKTNKEQKMCEEPTVRWCYNCGANLLALPSTPNEELFCDACEGRIAEKENIVDIAKGTIWTRQSGEDVKVLYANEKFVRFRGVESDRRRAKLKREFIRMFSPQKKAKMGAE